MFRNRTTSCFAENNYEVASYFFFGGFFCNGEQITPQLLSSDVKRGSIWSTAFSEDQGTRGGTGTCSAGVSHKQKARAQIKGLKILVGRSANLI